MEDTSGLTDIPNFNTKILPFLFVPAMIGNDLVGILVLSQSDHDYTKHDLAVVQQLADREAIQRARAVVEEKNPDLSETDKEMISRAVGLGALKYPMLARENTKIVTFDWQSALDFNGQAAPYIANMPMCAPTASCANCKRKRETISRLRYLSTRSIQARWN